MRVLSQGIHTSLRRRLAGAAAAVALAAASLVLVVSPASAHDELTGSDPASGTTLEALPAAITLTFSDDIADDPGASEMQVTDAAGTSLAAGEPIARDNTLTQPLAGSASGAITVLWKVVSSDGHPISGEYTFTVTAAPTPTATATPSPSATAESTPTPTPTLVEDDTDTASADLTPWLIAAGIVIVLLIAAVAYLLGSRSRRQKAMDAAAPGSSTPGDPGSDTTTER